MKRLLKLIIAVTCLLFISGCSSNEETEEVEENVYLPNPQNHTIEDLGATIVAAGTFWENWWGMRGPFAWENFEQFDCEQNPMPENLITSSPEHTAWLEQQEALHHKHMTRIPAHLHDRGAMEILLPSSGFTNINDIVNYLSHYYSDAWLARYLVDRDEAIPFVGSPFEYYDGVLFVDVNRAGFSPLIGMWQHTP